MNLIIKKNILLANLDQVSKGVSFKNLIPILNGIKFELKEEGLYLTGSDNNISIIAFIKKEKFEFYEGIGDFIIQGKYIVDIIRKLPNGNINLELLDETKLLITTKNSEFNLNCLNSNDYPNIEIEELKNPIILKEKIFKKIITQTSFATSTQESRPILTGINIKITNNIMECISTDSYRLAKVIVSLENNEGNFNIIIPSKNLNELIKIINNDDKKIEIHIFSNKILFKFSNILFQSKLLNGTYPDTSKLLPENAINNIIVNKNEFFEIIDRASLLTNEKEKNIISLESNDNEIIIKSNSPEIGKVEEKLIVDKKNNENIKISFSARYMLEALKTFEEENILIEFNGEVKPIIIKNIKDNNLIQLILPIRTY